MSSRITVAKLLVELHQVTDWYLLGVHLELPPHELNKICHQFQTHGVERCKVAVFDLWMNNNSSTTWDTIASALEKCGHKVIAERIQRFSSCSHVDTGISTVAAIDTALSPPCTQVIIVEEDIKDEFTEIEDSFAFLVANIKSSLESKEIPLKQLRRFLEEKLEESMEHFQINTIDDLFQQIRCHYCFLNICLLKSIVSRFIGEPLLLQLAEYKKRLQDFSERTKLTFLKECPVLQKFSLPSSIRESMPKVILKLPEFCLAITIKHFEKLVNHVFGTKSSSLTHIKVEDGCVCITWCVLKSAVSFLVANAQQTTEFMRQIGVLGLSIGDTIILEIDEGRESELVETMLRAASIESIEAGKFLAGIDPDYIAEGDCSLLASACIHGSLIMANFLLEAGANPIISDNYGYTPLMWASLTSHEAIVKLLLKSIHSKFLPNATELTLQICAKHNFCHSRILESLLAADGSDINELDDTGWNALMIACAKKNNELISMLLESRADPNVTGLDGHTALMIASQQQIAPAVNDLLKSGADPKLRNDFGWTALMCACAVKSVHPDHSILSSLLSAGVDPNSQSIYGCTALMIAAYNGYTEAVKILLDSQVDLNEQDMKGNTALHYAVQSNHLTVTELLLSAGASTTLVNCYLETALKIALSQNYCEIYHVLMETSSISTENFIN